MYCRTAKTLMRKNYGIAGKSLSGLAKEEIVIKQMRNTSDSFSGHGGGARALQASF
jgi:hypothetical protein